MTEQNKDEVMEAIISDEEDMKVTTKTNIFYLIVLKLFSGRFILTVSGAICFGLITKTVCHALSLNAANLTITEITSILSSVLIVVSNVFTFYFVRKAMSNEGPTSK